MNFKRLFSFILLLVLSGVVLAGALGLVYLLAVDATTPEEKTRVSLQLGGPFGLALIALLWFGVGLDRVLARLKRRALAIGVYLSLPLLVCLGLPAISAALVYGGLSAPTATGWRELPKPPQPAVEVASLNELTVTIRTAADAYYSCLPGSPSACWEFALAPEVVVTGRGTATSAPPPLDPPGDVVSLRGLTYLDQGEEGLLYFAVLRDGSVWVYRQAPNNARRDVDSYEVSFASGLLLTIAALPALAGLLVIYLGAGLSAVLRKVLA